MSNIKTLRCPLYLRNETNDNYKVDLGHAYIDIIDNHAIRLRCAKNSTSHLYELENHMNLLYLDMENDIPSKYYKDIEYNFLNGFNSNTCYNYSMFGLFKNNAIIFLNNLKLKINLDIKK